jgi:transcription-repair coupling factor (superfamily II helicase)
MNIQEITSCIEKDIKRQHIVDSCLSCTDDMFIEGIESPVLSVFVSMLKRAAASTVWVVFPTPEGAQHIRNDLRTIGEVYHHLHSTGKEMYAAIIDGTISTAEQLRVLEAVSQDALPKIIITTVRAFISPVTPKDVINDHRFTLKAQQQIDTETLAVTLSKASYDRVPRTTVPGEFSIRGEVIDIFPYEEAQPFRLFLSWDTIERISTFDPLTQDTLERCDLLSLCLIDADIRLSATATIEDYVNDSDYVVYVEHTNMLTSYDSLIKEGNTQFASLYNDHKTIRRPTEMLLDLGAFISSRRKNIHLLDIRGQHEQAICYDMGGPRSYFGNFNYFREELASLKTAHQQIIICAGSKLQQERLTHMVQDESVTVIEKTFSSGFTIPRARLVVICEHEIFGRRKRVRKAHFHYKSSPLDSFVDLQPGDYVVHINYGIGRFAKIDRIQAAGKERDYIDIVYANEDHIFIPIEQANLVQRYIGSEGKAPKLDTIGGRSWEGRKAKARKSAEDLAKMLIELYAKRKNSMGFPFAKDTDWQMQFEAAFPYEETEDQLTCISDVKQDMESPQVMDRLICGDVGFGKTEVAIRAAFKAVMSGKQVAFLAPTTILAEQHFETLKERMGTYPMTIEMLSRFVDRKDQKQIVKDFNAQKVDILIGTHRIIQKDLDFSHLGLMIVDEEQRFGVKDKERIKQLRTAVDSLALSATPIPRTLYMSLLKIRDMSLLTTPPFQRRAIKTTIEEFDEQLIAEAIRHEVARGGQVFFLHNRVNTLREIQLMLSRIVPEVHIDFAHGQMRSEEIEDKMHRFIHGAFQVLVATTIIENGIDIPNVNTIIIDRADIYGISQLYQLRGRVGRSNREAYALLLYPNEQVLTEIAMKRLKILSEHTDLGSGFKIAMKDMEIRGAGNLLGREQSGQMSAVGLDMYLRILDEAIADLQHTQPLQEKEVFLDLDYSGYIPDSYISDPSIKFDIYKKIASISTQEDLQFLEAELDDRFGRMPEDMTNLLYIAELKILCKRLSIYHLKEKQGVVYAEFSKVADISIEKAIQLIRESSGQITIDQKHPNIMKLSTDAVSLRDKSLFMLEKLQRLL